MRLLFARVPANETRLLSTSWFLSTPWFAQFQLLFGQPGWGADTLGLKQEFELNQVSRRCVAFADNEEPAAQGARFCPGGREEANDRSGIVRGRQRRPRCATRVMPTVTPSAVPYPNSDMSIICRLYARCFVLCSHLERR